MLNSMRARLVAVLIWAGCIIALAGCAGTGKDGVEPAHSARKPAPKPTFSAVTFSHEISPVGDMLRAFGETCGGGFVLMSGLEERAAETIDLRQETYERAIGHFAALVDSTYAHTPYYYVILPDGYEQLQQVAVAEHLDERYRDVTASAIFGAKTNLYVVFAALGASLDLTIVADNFIADARCGEVYLPEAPLGVILEAILKSARIAPDSFVVESTPEYIFLRDIKNEAAPSVRLQATDPEATDQTVLDREVSLVLPAEQQQEEAYIFSVEPMTLQDALYPITQQVGIEVVARRHLADIPINPCVMNKVRLETAMDLLIRQWPLAEFGWELQPGRILIRNR